MIAAIVILSVLLAGTIAAAVAMAYKVGAVRGNLTVAQDASGRAIQAAIDAEESAGERIRRKDLVIAGLKAKLRSIRNELQNDPDPIVRGSTALDSVLSLLAEFQNTDDPDPGSDNPAGQVSPSD